MSGDAGFVFVPFPTQWDRRQLGAIPQGARVARVWFGDLADEDCACDFDVPAYVERVVLEHAGMRGVFSSSDYPGAAAAALIAERLGLPGPPVAAVLTAGHKLRCREIAREVVPEATPLFARIDPEHPVAPFLPCFVKPIKGAFSMMTTPVASDAELAAFLRRGASRDYRRDYVRIFDDLVARFTDIRASGGDFLAEEILRGRLVTLEGFLLDGEVIALGVTDSVTDARTGSFVRFDYPSALPRETLAHLLHLSQRLIPRLGLERTLFNVEFFVEQPAGRAWIVEVNPRMCGQFADLYQKVEGWNSYEVALALALGERPRLARGAGRFRHASSFPLRTFAPARVRAAPAAERVREVESRVHDARIWIECETGQALLDFAEQEDGRSARYAVINVGGSNLDDVLGAREHIERALGIVLDPLAQEPRADGAGFT